MTDVAGSRRQTRDVRVRVGVPVLHITLIPLVLVLVIAAYIRDLLLFAIQANPFLNIAILTIALAAALFALLRARAVDQEKAQIARCASALSVPGEDHAGSRIFTGDIGRTLQKLTVSAKSDGPRSFTAAIDREMDLLRSVMNQRLSVLQYTTGLLISLGLLGTFLGLLKTLVASSAVLEAVGMSANAMDVGDATQAFSQMILSLREPLTNMGTAFSSSLFGLVGSIMVGVMVMTVQRAGAANITALRNMLTGSRMRLFDFRLDEKVDAAVVEDIVNAMLERERMALDRSGRVLDRVGSMSDSVDDLAQGLSAFSQRMEQAVTALDVLPDWCRRNDGLAQAIGATNTRMDVIEQALMRQNEILEGVADRQSQGQVQTDELLTRLVEGQEIQVELGRTGNARLDRLCADAAGHRSQLDAMVETSTSASRGITSMGDRLEVVGDRVRDLSGSVDSSAEGVLAVLGKLDGGIAQIHERLQQSGPELRAAATEIKDELHGISQAQDGLRLAVDRLGTTVAGGLADVAQSVPEIARHQAATVEKLDAGHALVATLTQELGAGFAALKGDTTALLQSLGESGRSLSAVQESLGDLGGQSQELKQAVAAGLSNLGDVHASMSAALRDLLASVTAQEAALDGLVEQGRTAAEGRRDGTRRMFELREELERIRSHLETHAQTTVGELAKLDRVLQLAEDMSSASRRGLATQEENGRALSGLLEQIADIRTIDHSMLETARAGREDMSRLVSALDRFAENDKGRAALLERMTSVVSELRLERQRDESHDTEVRGDLDRLRRSLAGIENTLSHFMKRLERFLGRDDTPPRD